MPELMSSKGAFRDGLKALLHWQSLLVVVMAAGLSWLAHRSQTNLSDVTFASSIAVLVFLLPAAGLVGPFLVSETSDAFALLTSAKQATDVEFLQANVRQMITAAGHLRRGFVYTTLAVVVSAVALVQPTWTVHHVALTEILGSTAIALLVNTALCAYPITWNLLQLKAVRTLAETVLSQSQEVESPIAEVESPIAEGQAAHERVAAKAVPPPGGGASK
jgi:hypothetical protein